MDSKLIENMIKKLTIPYIIFSNITYSNLDITSPNIIKTLLCSTCFDFNIIKIISEYDFPVYLDIKILPKLKFEHKDIIPIIAILGAQLCNFNVLKLINERCSSLLTYRCLDVFDKLEISDYATLYNYGFGYTCFNQLLCNITCYKGFSNYTLTIGKHSTLLLNSAIYSLDGGCFDIIERIFSKSKFTDKHEKITLAKTYIEHLLYVKKQDTEKIRINNGHVNILTFLLNILSPGKGIYTGGKWKGIHVLNPNTIESVNKKYYYDDINREEHNTIIEIIKRNQGLLDVLK